MQKIQRLQKFSPIMQKFLHDAAKNTFCSLDIPGYGEQILGGMGHNGPCPCGIGLSHQFMEECNLLYLRYLTQVQILVGGYFADVIIL